MIDMLHGDCLELLPSVADESVDMVFADLPYGVTQNKWDSVIPFEPLWEQLLRVGKRNAAFVFTATFKFACRLEHEAKKRKLKSYDLVWQKPMATGFLNAKKQPLRCHEHLLIFYKYQPTYNPQKTTGHKPYRLNVASELATTYGGKNYVRTADNEGERYPLSVIQSRIVRNSDRRIHPTQKPVALLEWLIKTYTNPGETVLDPTMGCGTTLVACKNTGRNGIGIEKDATYFETAQARLKESAA